MIGSTLAILLVTLAALRFLELPFLVLLPAVIATGVAAVLPADRGAWIGGLLAGVLLMRYPSSGLLAVATAVMPGIAAAIRAWTSVRPQVIALGALPVATYLASAAGSGSFSLPFGHILDLCAALAIGATLSVLAYAPTQGERLGPRRRTGLRIR